MAITPVSDRYHGFIFDGENSRDYGVYITEPAVFNAPERDVELISVPGRNGEYALDRGRFNNITVEYKCAFGGGTVADFNQGISAIRNMLASRKGYCRLSDEINTGEYRMALFSAGLDVSSLNTKTGEFTVQFNCKPQRFLTSGETPISVADGDVIENPTAYASSPLIELDGYGTLVVNRHEIDVADGDIGDIVLVGDRYYRTETAVVKIDTSQMRNGDPMLLVITNHYPAITNTPGFWYSVYLNGPAYGGPVTDCTPGTLVANVTGIDNYTASPDMFYHRASLDLKGTIHLGTPATCELSCPAVITWKENGTTKTQGFTVSCTLSYDGQRTFTLTRADTIPDELKAGDSSLFLGLIGKSTLSIYGHIYIDTDLGEVYKMEDGQLVSLNAFVDLGDTLPTLSPGENTITYDSTFDACTITPRWWNV